MVGDKLGATSGAHFLHENSLHWSIAHIILAMNLYWKYHSIT